MALKIQIDEERNYRRVHGLEEETCRTPGSLRESSARPVHQMAPECSGDKIASLLGLLLLTNLPLQEYACVYKCCRPNVDDALFIVGPGNGRGVLGGTRSVDSVTVTVSPWRPHIISGHFRGGPLLPKCWDLFLLFSAVILFTHSSSVRRTSWWRKPTTRVTHRCL